MKNVGTLSIAVIRPAGYLEAHLGPSLVLLLLWYATFRRMTIPKDFALFCLISQAECNSSTMRRPRPRSRTGGRGKGGTGNGRITIYFSATDAALGSGMGHRGRRGETHLYGERFLDKRKAHSLPRVLRFLCLLNVRKMTLSASRLLYRRRCLRILRQTHE